MNKLLKLLLGTLVSVLSLLGVLFIAVIIYYWPVIDRLYINTCNYYPHTFKDCVERK